MKRALQFLAVSAALCVMVPETRADQAAVEDVTIWWSPWYPRKAQPINLFVNGNLLGSGREGMEAALEIVRKLPRGTSVVWGPNIKKSWSGPPGEKSTVPKAFPDLWGQFLEATRANGLVVSTSFYGGYSGPQMSSVASVIAAGGPRGAEDVLVRWEFVPPYSLDIFVQEKLVGRDAQGVLAVKQVLETLPADRTVRFVLAKSRPGDGSVEEMFAWDALVDGTYESTLARVIQRRRLRAFIEKPEQLMLASEKAAHRVTLSWCNYDYLRETPQAEVVYLVNGSVMGLGDAGMDAVLAFLREQPDHTLLSMPQFSTSKLVPDVDKDRVPFPGRREEFEAVVKRKRIEVDYDLTVPETHHQSDSIDSMASLGRIVRDGQAPQRADLVLSWKNFAATDARADPGKAVYTLNGDEVGKGVTGFLGVVKRIDALPNGAVLRLDPVSIRTTGPFPCPIMIAGHRHFARTGREPYHHLSAILAEVVKRKSLQVELIPDEGKAETSCIAK